MNKCLLLFVILQNVCRNCNLKKNIVILTILLLLLVDFLRPLYLSFWLYNWRKQIRRELKSEIKSRHLIKLTFSKKDLQEKNISLIFVKEDEFRYNNMMYDVVTIDQTADSVTYTCYQDIKEILQISALIGSFTNSGTFLPKFVDLKSQILSFIYYIITLNTISIFFTPQLLQSFYHSSSIIFIISDVPEPPPKVSI